MSIRLLVPLDGSDKDPRALQVADAFARLLGGELRLLRLIDAPATKVSAGLAILGAVPEPAPAAQADIERQLRESAGKLAGSGYKVTANVAAAPDVSAELLRRAELDADIVIMATRGPGTVARAFLGSVADIVVRKSSRPVVIVPPGARYGVGNRIELKRVLVPLDGSRMSLAAMDRFLEHAPSGKFEYVLMQAVRQEGTGGHVMPEPVRDSEERTLSSQGSKVLHVQAEQAETRLHELASRCKARGDIAAIRVVESTDPADAILGAIRGELVDLIVMSTHGEGGLRRALHGSVANRVARESEVPVFLVTPESAGSSQRPW